MSLKNNGGRLFKAAPANRAGLMRGYWKNQQEVVHMFYPFLMQQVQ